jgi:hypothetical protein
LDSDFAPAKVTIELLSKLGIENPWPESPIRFFPSKQVNPEEIDLDAPEEEQKVSKNSEEIDLDDDDDNERLVDQEEAEEEEQ